MAGLTIATLGLGIVVGAAVRSPFRGALLAAVSNGGNEHALRGTMLGRWYSAYGVLRAA